MQKINLYIHLKLEFLQAGHYELLLHNPANPIDFKFISCYFKLLHAWDDFLLSAGDSTKNNFKSVTFYLYTNNTNHSVNKEFMTRCNEATLIEFSFESRKEVGIVYVYPEGVTDINIKNICSSTVIDCQNSMTTNINLLLAVKDKKKIIELGPRADVYYILDRHTNIVAEFQKKKGKLTQAGNLTQTSNNDYRNIEEIHIVIK